MPAAIASPELLTCEQAAEYLNIQAQTLAKWRSEGTYPIPFVRVGRAIRYRRRDLEKWLESRTVSQ